MIGIDPRELTLRQLFWMAQAHREFLGELTAWNVSMICAHIPFTKGQLDPRRINPYRRRDTAIERKIAEVKAFIAAAGLGSFANR